jgi:hypothetical protein
MDEKTENRRDAEAKSGDCRIWDASRRLSSERAVENVAGETYERCFGWKFHGTKKACS